jgi:hypothetical protein
MLDLYLSRIQEGYILSDKTISVNLDDFESGKNKKLLIIGMSGSGKTTLGEKLAKKYRVKWISIDSYWWRLRQKYFKDAPNTDETERKLIKKLVEFVIDTIKNNERLIIEGVDILNIYSEFPKYRKIILNQSLIILGLSSLRAGIRAGLRNRKREGGEGWRELYWMVKFNMKHFETILKAIRKKVQSVPSNDIKLYKIKK